jgi:DNA-binding Lrp family transcriptional regulator
LDDTDIGILNLLQKETKITTSQLSEQLKVPKRTIRYRLKKLKKKGLLRPPKVLTYERKIGLGERLLLLQCYPQNEEKLIKVLDEISIFYYYGPTYGKYDGYFIYAMYPLVAPRIILQIAEEMKDKELVKEFFIFDMVDYTRKAAEITPFLPSSQWEWDTWSREIERIMKEGCKLDLGLEEFPKTISFDFKDIQIIKHIVENPEYTLSEIEELLDVSLTQVFNRVKRLEENGIIRGMKPTVIPFSETIKIGCIFKSRKNAEKILCGFYELPFEVEFSMESRAHYQIWVNLPPSETGQFLQRLSFFRRYTEEYFVQIVSERKHKGYSHMLATYNNKTKSWEMPLDEILRKIKEITK